MESGIEERKKLGKRSFFSGEKRKMVGTVVCCFVGNRKGIFALIVVLWLFAELVKKEKKVSANKVSKPTETVKI